MFQLTTILWSTWAIIAPKVRFISGWGVSWSSSVECTHVCTWCSTLASRCLTSYCSIRCSRTIVIIFAPVFIISGILRSMIPSSGTWGLNFRCRGLATQSRFPKVSTIISRSRCWLRAGRGYITGCSFFLCAGLEKIITELMQI